MADLLFGLETEYPVACITSSGTTDGDQISYGLMGIARRELLHLPDLGHPSGIFLQNGSRMYVDCGHPEICTPECTNPWEVVRYTLAGHRILAGLAASLGSAKMPGAELVCWRGNVDYSGQSTWASHENYLHTKSLDVLQQQVIPHLVSRLVYTGAGGFNPLSRGLEFTLSPRVAHLRQVVSGNSTGERGIWHTKSEPLSAKFGRLHVLCGESLCSHVSAFLRVGATALVVAMADAGLTPGIAVQLAEPLEAMRAVARDVTCKRPLRMADGRKLTALEIQRHYLEQAEAHLHASFMPEWAPEVCHRWRGVLDQLEEAPGSVAQSLDWGIKLALYAHYARSVGVQWDALPFWNKVIGRLAAALKTSADGPETLPLEVAIGPSSPIPKEIARLDPLLRSRGFQWQDLKTVLDGRQKLFEIDTRFGQLGPKGIFEALDAAGVLNHRVSGVDNIEQAVTEPPATGRARIRGRVIQRLAGAEHSRCDWQSIIDFKKKKVLDLSDPFTNEESWRPLTPAEKQLAQRDTAAFAFVADIWNAELSCQARRQDAADRILSGDYAGAEAIVRGLLQEGFMVPSSHCHLARALLMMNREGESREEINQAWAVREQAATYVVGRILFFQCVFAMFDGAAITPIVREIRATLRDPDAHLDWTIQPMLDHLRQRLGETNYRFLKALAEALCDRVAMPRLDEFPQWRDAAAATSDRGMGGTGT
jgi:hypothetical protein